MNKDDAWKVAFAKLHIQANSVRQLEHEIYLAYRQGRTISQLARKFKVTKSYIKSVIQFKEREASLRL